MKAIYMVLLAMVFLIPLVSGLEFDNRLTYEDDDMTGVITNAFGFGKEIGRVTLKSHDSPTQIRNVIRGKDRVVMYYDFKFDEIYQDGLGEVSFIDSRTGKEIEKDYHFVKEVYTYRTVNEYEDVCGDVYNDVNETWNNVCVKNKIGSHEVKKANWEKIGNDVPKGEVRIGLATDVSGKDYIDGIWKIAGQQVAKHAEWTESLNTDIVAYWPFANVSDVTGNGHDLGVNEGTPQYTTVGCLIGGCFASQDNDNLNLNGDGEVDFGYGDNDFTWSVWVNYDNVANPGYFFGRGAVYSASTGNDGSNTDYWGTDWWSPSGAKTGSIGSSTTWYQYTMVYDATASNLTLWKDATPFFSSDLGSIRLGGAIDSNFGTRGKSDVDLNGKMDEMGYWDRALSISEVIQLYNSGNGVTYIADFTTAPNITFPENTTYVSELSSINYTQGGNAYCWASTDGGATNTTTVTAGVNFTGLSSGGGSSTWTVYCNDTSNVVLQDNVTFFVEAGVETHLKSPADALSTTDTTIEFEVNATASGGATLRNQTIYLYYSNSTLLATNYSTISGLTSSRKFNYTFADGAYIWNAITEANSSTIFVNDWDTNRTFTVDSTAPIITITYPTTAIDFHKVNNNLRINWTVSDVTAGLDLCWIEYQSVNTTVTCNNNGTLINITNSGDKSAVFYANDTLGNQNSNSFNWSYKVFWNSETFNTTVYESQTQTYILNMSSTGDETVTANFSFNGINYTTTKEGTNTQMNFTFSHDLPIGVGTFNFSWNVFYGSDIITTPAQSQTVDLLNLSICGLGGLNTPFINFTARDEVTDLPLDFTVDIADWTYYYLGAGDVSKIYSYVDVSANISSFAFCATPNLTIQQSLEVKYSDFIGDYPLRTYQTLDPMSNTTTNTILYLLKTTDGEDITLQVVSPSGVPIEGVYVNVTRTISGNLVLLGSGSTGADGGINFFLNPDFIHTFTFVKAGYDTLITSFQPKDSTITLGAAITGNQTYDFLRGISWAIKPLDFTLENETHYIFNYSFANNGYWVVDEWGFILTNNSGFVLGSNSSTTSAGGNLNVNVTTGNNSYILMNYYWNIGGNYSNATKIWGVLDQTPKGTISGFINLLKLYTSDCVNCTADETSLFGLTLWGRTLLIFFAIFILTGTLAYTSGIYSPTAIAAFASGWITLFDIGLELLPLLPNSLAVHGVYSIISWMVVLMIGYREAMR